jgi:lipopolysaccharide transport system ATP-binding protein
MATLVVSGVGKAYSQYPTRWSRLAEWLAPWRGLRHHRKWVLRDVTFSVNSGEAIGVMGVNGAGKSTLLKIIAGTTLPTEGSVQVNGRLAAILELGMGFHPDFTGRDNAFMAAQLLGFPTREIENLMPEIEEFAEIGDYIDQPVRVYSSGMQMRLAFSVATAVKPDVLIVDEALSVGDAYFQHKSFDRIRQFRCAGTSLLLVSHDRSAIQSICDRAILLDAGRPIREGTPEEVADFYNALIASRENTAVSQTTTGDGRVQTVSGTGEATVADVALLDHLQRRVEVVDVGAPVTLRVKVRVNAAIQRLVCGYVIKDRLGQPMFGTNTHLRDMPLLDLAAGESPEFRFSFPANLGPGSYSVAVALTGAETHIVDNFEWRDLALVFNVANITRSHFVGCNWLEPEIVISR